MSSISSSVSYKCKIFSKYPLSQAKVITNHIMNTIKQIKPTINFIAHSIIYTPFVSLFSENAFFQKYIQSPMQKISNSNCIKIPLLTIYIFFQKIGET